MPHFGLIDESLPDKEKYLLRARLHIRGGKIRLSQGDISAGIAALYDAIIYSLYWFFLSNKQLESFLYDEQGKYKHEKDLYLYLIEHRSIDGKFNMEKFSDITEEALNTNLFEFKANDLLEEYEGFMEQLKVLPYDENILPIDEPVTL
ncbi:MAG: hypothetical protein ACFFEN_12445 [Candidatus Thorarchaeota archaeon]